MAHQFELANWQDCQQLATHHILNTPVSERNQGSVLPKPGLQELNWIHNRISPSSHWNGWREGEAVIPVCHYGNSQFTALTKNKGGDVLC